MILYDHSKKFSLHDWHAFLNFECCIMDENEKQHWVWPKYIQNYHLNFVNIQRNRKFGVVLMNFSDVSYSAM